MASSSESEMSSCMLEFCLDIFKHIAKQEPTENGFLSPSSIMLVMSMVHAGAGGNTLVQMSKALRFEHFKQKDPYTLFGKLMSTLKKENKNFTLKSANRLYPHTDKTILDKYVKSVTKQFLADVKSMDYTNHAEEARLEINKWVEAETNQKIKDLLAPGILDSLTAMVIVNAIYFKGDWATQFDKDATHSAEFYKLDSSTVQIEMMTKKMKNVGYGLDESMACAVLELPYKGEELSMIIVLPENNQGLLKLEQSLNLQTFQNLMSSMRKSTVDVFLPKFKLETSYKLNDVLASLGMPDLFNPTAADLSGMSELPLFVSHVVHKAFVEVNEEGTEAAAATAAVMMKRSIQITPRFIADHPFLFIIHDKRQKVPLFIGRVVSLSGNGPLQQREDL